MAVDWTNVDAADPGVIISKDIQQEIYDNIEDIYNNHFGAAVTHWQFDPLTDGEIATVNNISGIIDVVDNYISVDFCTTNYGDYSTCPAYLGSDCPAEVNGDRGSDYGTMCTLFNSLACSWRHDSFLGAAKCLQQLEVIVYGMFRTLYC